jgi:hypothetical protein
MHCFNLQTRQAKGEGIIHMIDNLILRVLNLKQKCVINCQVSNAHNCPLKRVGVETNVCG